MWRHSDLFTVFSQGYQAIGEVPTTRRRGSATVAKQMREAGVSGPCLAAAPLMHGMAWFTSMGRLMTGVDGGQPRPSAPSTRTSCGSSSSATAS